MNTKDENMIQDYDAILDERYGAKGTPQRAKFAENAYAYYSGQILKEARKNARLTQIELAQRTQTTKSYISRIENGGIVPSVAVFYKMISALGMSIKIVNTQANYVSEPEAPIYGKVKSDI